MASQSAVERRIIAELLDESGWEKLTEATMGRKVRAMAIVSLAGLGAAVVGELARSQSGEGATSGPASRVFEIRTYTAEEGKLDALSSRFRDHTMKIFAKHHIE